MSTTTPTLREQVADTLDRYGWTVVSLTVDAHGVTLHATRERATGWRENLLTCEESGADLLASLADPSTRTCVLL